MTLILLLSRRVHIHNWPLESMLLLSFGVAAAISVSVIYVWTVFAWLNLPNVFSNWWRYIPNLLVFCLFACFLEFALRCGPTNLGFLNLLGFCPCVELSGPPWKRPLDTAIPVPLLADWFVVPSWMSLSRQGRYRSRPCGRWSCQCRYCKVRSICRSHTVESYLFTETHLSYYGNFRWNIFEICSIFVCPFLSGRFLPLLCV